MHILELNEALVEFLRGTIPSPHASGNWIYMGYPRSDATFPRISVTMSSGGLSPIAIGELVGETLGEQAEFVYDIDIWVKKNDRLSYSGTVYVGTKLRDFYADFIIQSLIENKSMFKEQHGLDDIIIEGVSESPFDEELDLHRKTITIRIPFIWKKVTH